jgi:phenylalanyl-tRNA synthetase beta chain
VIVASGGTEAVTYVTVSRNELEPFIKEDGQQAGFLFSVRFDDLLKIKNPLQSGRNILRPTIVPSLLESVSQNLKHSPSVRLFELARIYLPTTRDELPTEIEVAAIAISGRREPLGLGTHDKELDYFDLKGIVDELFARLSIDAVVTAEPFPGLHPGRSAVYRAGDSVIARIGEVHPETSRQFGIEDTRVTVAELDLQRVLKLQPEKPAEVRVPRFLPVEQDFAVVVDEATRGNEVSNALLAGAGPLATGITLFDVYRGGQVGEGMKSLAFRVSFTAPDRQLTDADLVSARTRIERVLKQRVNGVLRT